MKEKTKIVFEIISVFGCCLAVFTLFFGDNLYQQISGHSIFQNLPSPTITSYAPQVAVGTSTSTSIPTMEVATHVWSSETLTQSSTPTIPTVTPKDMAVNCRTGPGLEWDVVSALNIGQIVPILGKSSDLEWWYIVDPFNSSRHCWVSALATTTRGDLTVIPVVEAQ